MKSASAKASKIALKPALSKDNQGVGVNQDGNKANGKPVPQAPEALNSTRVCITCGAMVKLERKDLGYRLWRCSNGHSYLTWG